MDNRVFNVNGEGEERLTKTLELAFGDWRGADGWRFDKDHGLIVLWSVDEGDNKFPVCVGPKSVSKMAMEWLTTDDAKKVAMEGWDADHDHDGSNELGWRVYVNDWGHVGDCRYAICAIKPAYIWYGK